MSNELQLFNNPEFGSVRVITLDEEPWFVGKDVAEILGYANAYEAVFEHVDEVDRKCLKFKDNSNLLLSNKSNDLQKALWENPNDFKDKWLINDSGVYSLAFGSKLPSAKAFRHWVTAEVLPSIRNTGIYMTPTTAAQVVEDPFYAVKLAEKTLAQYTQAINAWKQAVENLEAEKQMHQNTKEHLALTEQQRDEAIRTKACISDKKTATAMATASAAVRKTASLENRLGEGDTWKTVVAIPWLKTVFNGKSVPTNQIGTTLSKLSRELGYPVKDAPDPRWGFVHRYHIDIINHFYEMLMNDESLYRSYRRK